MNVAVCSVSHSSATLHSTRNKHETKFLNLESYPRDDQLSPEVLNLSLDFAADVKLVAVEGDALQVGQQVGLAGGVGALQQREREGSRYSLSMDIIWFHEHERIRFENEALAGKTINLFIYFFSTSPLS